MTGFLEPTLSYSSDGLDFMIPYFKVISEKSDVTLAARNISERGFGFEGNIQVRRDGFEDAKIEIKSSNDKSYHLADLTSPKN